MLLGQGEAKIQARNEKLPCTAKELEKVTVQDQDTESQQILKVQYLTAQVDLYRFKFVDSSHFRDTIHLFGAQF